MRRLGRNPKSRERQLTYVESLFSEILPQIRESIAAADVDPLHAVAREVIKFEAEDARFELPDLSDREVLEALAAYTLVLLDNDRLPPPAQLSNYELGIARELLISAACGAADATKHSDRVLTLLEEKFNGGKFPQAAILLRLFATTAARQRNNERTLFYEEMFARFGVMRLNRIPAHVCKRYHEALEEEETAEGRVLAAAEWLQLHADVSLDLLQVPHSEEQLWNDVLEPAGEAAAGVREFIPHGRWRNVQECEDTGLLSAARRHVTPGAFADYMGHLLKVCYFTVLVTGKTGFESFIRDYFRWVEQHFEVPGPRLLPELHRLTTIGEQGLDDTVAALRDHWMTPNALPIVDSLRNGSLVVGVERLAEDLQAIDPSDIPPGDYDLGGLLVDRATGLETADPLALFRVHRLG